MGCRWYVAMTGAEFLQFTPIQTDAKEEKGRIATPVRAPARNDGLSGNPLALAWMACRFSLENPGLGNLPKQLPVGSLLILDDHIPFDGHDVALISKTAAQTAALWGCDGILLDLQRQWEPQALIHAICRDAPCPVAVTERYAQDAPCAVFLSCDLNIPLRAAVAPWKGRELWLDVAVGMQEFTLSAKGCEVSPILRPQGQVPHEGNHCRYRIKKEPRSVVFSLCRDAQMLPGLLEEAASLGITKSVGLYQELYKKEITLDW